MTSKLFLLLIFLSCSSTQKSNTKELENSSDKHPVASCPFNFEIPDRTQVLDRQLIEISGLAYDFHTNQFICHNDEQAKVFYLDNNLELVKSKKWGRSGDFEAIEVKEQYIYSLKSNGTLYIFNQETEKVKSQPTRLKTVQNPEGLCFDYKSNNILLIACKGEPLSKTSTKNSKYIYSYELNNQSLNVDPMIEIAIDSLIIFTKNKLNNSGSSKEISKLKKFAPSAIAVDPFSGDYYISSAKGSSLIIYNQQRQLKDVIFLNSRTLPQPEGLTFDKAGNLYISTEGQGSSGKIFKYVRQQ